VWQDRSDQEGFKGMGFVIKKIVVHSEPTRLRAISNREVLVALKHRINTAIFEANMAEIAPK